MKDPLSILPIDVINQLPVPCICRESLRFLSKHYPQYLLDMINQQLLEPVDLTFAAEYAGKINSEQVKQTLLPLLKHPSAIVREGALYGLEKKLDEEIVSEISNLAKDDPSESIRRIADEIVNDWFDDLNYKKESL